MSNNARADVRPMSPRVEQERAQRRRRQDLGVGRLSNLAIAGTLDHRYVYRWINDDPGRVHQMTEMDDWDRVTAQEIGGTSEKDRQVGSHVERVVDKTTGKRGILVKKLREYYLEDKAKEQAALDDTDAAIRRGQTPTQTGQAAPADLGSSGYVPSGGIVVQDGRKG